MGFKVPGFLRGLRGGRDGRGEGRNPHGHPLKPAAAADRRGWLTKQGDKVSAWQKRYFVLHGALLAYYDDEEE